jgi:hypothetical protein
MTPTDKKPTTDQLWRESALGRLDRLERENEQLRADLGTFIHEAYPHMPNNSRPLADLKARYSPDALETRPFGGLPEQRKVVNV